MYFVFSLLIKRLRDFLFFQRDFFLPVFFLTLHIFGSYGLTSHYAGYIRKTITSFLQEHAQLCTEPYNRRRQMLLTDWEKVNESTVYEIFLQVSSLKV